MAHMAASQCFPRSQRQLAGRISARLAALPAHEHGAQEDKEALSTTPAAAHKTMVLPSTPQLPLKIPQGPLNGTLRP